MKTSVTVELLTKGLQKAERAANAIKGLGRAADKADREGRQLARTEERLRRSNDRLARSEDKTARAFHKSTEAARRQKNALLALERQQDRVAAKARRRDAGGRVVSGRRGGGRAAVGGGIVPINPLTGAMAGAGAGFASGMGLAVGGGVGAVGTGVALSVRGAAKDEFTADQLRVLGGYSEQQEKVILKALEKTGRKRGIGMGGAFDIFGGLMAGGLSHEDASGMTGGVAIFAQATQAQLDEAAATTIALRNNMKITKDEMMAAYDAMVIGGKRGQFEVRDMAKDAPSLLAKMEVLGEKGVQGVRNMVAMAQAVRTATGSSDEAATNLSNLLDKITAKDFIKNAEDFGINVEKAMKRANDRGLSPVLEVLEEVRREIGNDPVRLNELVPDRQARAAIIAILKAWDQIRTDIDKMGNSAGETMRDFEIATDNASTAFDRFASNISTSMKSTVAPALSIATEAMNALSDSMEGEPTKLKKVDDWAKSFLSDLPVSHLFRWFAGNETEEKPAKAKKPKYDARDALRGIADRNDGFPRMQRQYREYGALRAAAPIDPVYHKPPPATLLPPAPTPRPDPVARKQQLPGQEKEGPGGARAMPVPTSRPRPANIKAAQPIARVDRSAIDLLIAMLKHQAANDARREIRVPVPTPRPARRADKPVMPVPIKPWDPIARQRQRQPGPPVAVQPWDPIDRQQQREPGAPVPVQPWDPIARSPQAKRKSRAWPPPGMPMPRRMPVIPIPKPDPDAGMNRIWKRMEKMRREFEEEHGDPRAGRGKQSRLQGTFKNIAKEAKASSATVKQEMGDMQSAAFSAGQKTAQQLAAGLRSGKPAVGAAAAELASEVSAHFPQSPVKKGPLRSLPQMGAKIAAQIADGMQPQSPVKAARAIAAKIAGETPKPARQEASTASTAGRGPKSVGVTINKIEINGVRGAEEAVDRLGLSIERRISGTLADVG